MRTVLVSSLALAVTLAAMDASCSPPKGPRMTAARILGQPWHVVGIGDGDVGGATVTIRFNERLMASGKAPCNSYASDYRLKGEALKFGHMISTKKACAPEMMELEQRFLAMLGEVERAEIAPDGSLVLHAANERRIVARRV